jgi:hypothetical protein
LLIRSLILPRTAIAAENLALRQQMAVLIRKIHRPQLRRRDRFFWMILSRLWMTLKIAILAPIPGASAITDASVKPGSFNLIRVTHLK